MEWLVLKNRRHVGPFTVPELREALRHGRVLVDDYVVSLHQAESGDLKYLPLHKVLGLSEESLSVHRGAARLKAGPIPKEALAEKRNMSEAPLYPSLLDKLESSDFVPGMAEPRKAAPVVVESAPMVEQTAVAPKRRRSWWLSGAVMTAVLAFGVIQFIQSKPQSKTAAADTRPVAQASPKTETKGLRPIVKDRPGTQRDLRVPELPRQVERAPEPYVDSRDIAGPEPASILPAADGENPPMVEGASPATNDPNLNAPVAVHDGNAAAAAAANAAAAAAAAAAQIQNGFAPYGGGYYDPQQLQLLQQMMLQQQQFQGGELPQIQQKPAAGDMVN